VTARFCDEYFLGAYFLIDSTDSISLPFCEDEFVVISEMPVVTTLLLLSTILPLKLNEDAPFALSPFVIL